MNRDVAEHAAPFRTSRSRRPTRGGSRTAGRHRRRQGRADAAPAGGTRPTRSASRQGREGEQEADGLRRGGLQRGPFVRTAEDILDEVLREERAADRPRPQHKHVWAEMTQRAGRRGAQRPRDVSLSQQALDLHGPRLGHDRPVICLMDGERALWAGTAGVASASGRRAGHVPRPGAAVGGGPLLPRGGQQSAAERFVEQRLRELLEGRVGYVIGGLRRLLTQAQAQRREAEVVSSAVEYLENNREHMRYDEYLAAGYPIGSGVAEGACRHLVKDRHGTDGHAVDGEGAQAMLHVRAIYLNDDWEDYLNSYIETEQSRLYRQSCGIAGCELRPNEKTSLVRLLTGVFQ